MTIEEYFEEQKSRYEIVLTGGWWHVHDRQECTYTWGMTMDEVRDYLRKKGINPQDVPVMN